MRIKAADPKKILIVEPYYGGSHRLFLEGLQKNISADYTSLTLPARKWKMRMQLSALWFVEEVKKMAVEKRKFDIVLASTFVDLALLRLLLTGLEGWSRDARFHSYFHENQFVYPGRAGDHFQFQAINFTTALASDRIAFNSCYNRETFRENCLRYLETAVDMKVSGVMEEIEKKSSVLHPGLDFTELDRLPPGPKSDIPVILWNHRWEHDKDPESFFSVLYTLQDRGIPFGLIVVGQSFRDEPACFQEARSRLASRTLHFGYVESRPAYLSLLRQADIIVSTARQEFFGISVIEAVRAGCRPLLPDRLSYQELFAKKFLYTDGELPQRLAGLLQEQCGLDAAERRKMTDGYLWDVCRERYEEWLFR